MSDVINKTTLAYMRSVHTPDFRTGWLINPVLPGCDSVYWKIKSDKVLEMTVSEKNTKDMELAAIEMEMQKEQLISDKSRDMAIEELKNDGILDSSGDIIGG